MSSTSVGNISASSITDADALAIWISQVTARDQFTDWVMAVSPTQVSRGDRIEPAKYVKVAFFGGTSLRPLPPGESKQKEVRYLDIHEDDQLDEAQMATWVQQAAALPGWAP